jgi:hypothetical protein
MVARGGLLLVALFASSCDTKATPREPDEYTGCGTDEHWRTFDDQAPVAKVDDSMAPVFTQPSPGPIPPNTKPVLAWQQDPNDPGQKDGDVPCMGVGCNNCCPEFDLGALTSLHLPPISGNVYDLQFVVGGSTVHRVITTLQEWTPPDALWTSWKGKSISVKIWRMDLLHNDVKAGPYTPTKPFQFSESSS